MILHITFSDGSNPWVCFSDDRQEIAEHWREWMKEHATIAQPQTHKNGYICELSTDRAGYLVYKQGCFWSDGHRKYKHLGHALAALDRLGGKDA